jgi:hypothetical protein
MATTYAPADIEGSAAEAGYCAGLAVVCGIADEATVGAEWAAWADASHADGVAWARAYDAAVAA